MRLALSTKKLLILLAVADALLICAYAYGFQMLMSRNDQAAELSQKVSSYSATNETLSGLQSSLSIAEKGMQQVDSYLISTDGVVGFIGLVESMARQAGLKPKVDSVDAGDIDAATKAFEERITLRFETAGSYASTEHFLKLLETLPLGTVVKAVSMERVDDPGQGAAARTPQWKAVFEITALKIKQ